MLAAAASRTMLVVAASVGMSALVPPAVGEAVVPRNQRSSGSAVAIAWIPPSASRRNAGATTFPAHKPSLVEMRHRNR